MLQKCATYIYIYCTVINFNLVIVEFYVLKQEHLISQNLVRDSTSWFTIGCCSVTEHIGLKQQQLTSQRIVSGNDD